MNSYYIRFETLNNIADAIRTKKETSILMSPLKMITEIQNIKYYDTDIPPMAYASNEVSYFSSQDNLVLDMAFYSCSSLQSVNLPNASYIGSYAFNHCYSLQSVNLPMTNYIGLNAFGFCSSLQSIDLPIVSYIGDYAFVRCSSLQSIDLPIVSYIGNYAFMNCISLQSINLPNVSYIGNYAFSYCYNLLSLYLGSTSICELATSKVFDSTPIAGYTTSTGGVYGSIYVPASLLASYKTATNWAAFSSRFVGI